MLNHTKEINKKKNNLISLYNKNDLTIHCLKKKK